MGRTSRSTTGIEIREGCAAAQPKYLGGAATPLYRRRRTKSPFAFFISCLQSMTTALTVFSCDESGTACSSSRGCKSGVAIRVPVRSFVDPAPSIPNRKTCPANQRVICPAPCLRNRGGSDDGGVPSVQDVPEFRSSSRMRALRRWNCIAAIWPRAHTRARSRKTQH